MKPFSDYLIDLFNSNLTEWGNADYYDALSEQQKNVIQAIKRYYKRKKT